MLKNKFKIGTLVMVGDYYFSGIGVVVPLKTFIKKECSLVCKDLNHFDCANDPMTVLIYILAGSLSGFYVCQEDYDRDDFNVKAFNHGK